MAYKIPLFDLNFNYEEEKAVVKTLRSKWIAMGKNVLSLESTWVNRSESAKGFFGSEIKIIVKVTIRITMSFTLRISKGCLTITLAKKSEIEKVNNEPIMVNVARVNRI